MFLQFIEKWVRFETSYKFILHSPGFSAQKTSTFFGKLTKL